MTLSVAMDLAPLSLSSLSLFSSLLFHLPQAFAMNIRRSPLPVYQPQPSGTGYPSPYAYAGNPSPYSYGDDPSSSYSDEEPTTPDASIPAPYPFGNASFSGQYSTPLTPINLSPVSTDDYLTNPEAEPIALCSPNENSEPPDDDSCRYALTDLKGDVKWFDSQGPTNWGPPGSMAEAVCGKEWSGCKYQISVHVRILGFDVERGGIRERRLECT